MYICQCIFPSFFLCYLCCFGSFSFVVSFYFHFTLFSLHTIYLSVAFSFLFFLIIYFNMLYYLIVCDYLHSILLQVLSLFVCSLSLQGVYMCVYVYTCLFFLIWSLAILNWNVCGEKKGNRKATVKESTPERKQFMIHGLCVLLLENYSHYLLLLLMLVIWYSDTTRTVLRDYFNKTLYLLNDFQVAFVCDAMRES